MELHTAALLNRRDEGYRRPASCDHYLEQLGLERAQRDAVLRSAGLSGATGGERAFETLQRALAANEAGPAAAARPGYGSVPRRLAAAAKGSRLEGAELTITDAQGRPRLASAPPPHRSSMAPQKLDRPAARGSSSYGPGHWHAASIARRLLLATLALGQTWLATHFMASVLPYGGRQPLELAIMVLFAILFGWISLGFWTALAGFVLLLSGRDKASASLAPGEPGPLPEEARTAVIMPICNESVERVFAGLRATWDSLAATGQGRHFDFFVLSDSSDADCRVAELSAWLSLCRDIGLGRVFYRWRRHRIKRKSGNVADFCRRWGRNYRYMVVMDADSVMSGECLAHLVRLMEANGQAGIIQTAPRAFGRDTLYARMQQFAIRVYGPLFTAGLHFWQLGESHYWGHNAIIRVAPFMRHCALARLPGRGPLSGEILSHDFVEAALMRRAGWGVWIAYDLPGSYEQVPPNLIDELQRDRRWCQGNLMNFRLMSTPGLHPTHRAMFVIGVMAYLSAPLWCLALVLSTALLAVHTLGVPQYFVEPYQLFPLWPEWNPGSALLLFTTTAFLLFLPKLLAVVLAARQEARRYGGGLRLFASMLGEFLFSAMLAPIRMLFHTQFVLTTLAGRVIKWKSPPREDAETTWAEALRRHGAHTLMGTVWLGGVYWLNPSYLWWLLPVAGALALSVPLSVISSRISLGQRARRGGLLMIPEESRPPKEMRWTRKYLRGSPAAEGADFVQAVVHPRINALVCAAGVARLRACPGGDAERGSEALADRALREGPQALPAADKARLLDDPLALSRLHARVWTDAGAHPQWREERRALPQVAPPAVMPLRVAAA